MEDTITHRHFLSETFEKYERPMPASHSRAYQDVKPPWPGKCVNSEVIERAVCWPGRTLSNDRPPFDKGKTQPFSAYRPVWERTAEYDAET